MNDPEASRIMMRIASGYARKAKRAARLANGHADPIWTLLRAKFCEQPPEHRGVITAHNRATPLRTPGRLLSRRRRVRAA